MLISIPLIRLKISDGMLLCVIVVTHDRWYFFWNGRNEGFYIDIWSDLFGSIYLFPCIFVSSIDIVAVFRQSVRFMLFLVLMAHSRSIYCLFLFARLWPNYFVLLFEVIFIDPGKFICLITNLFNVVPCISYELNQK